MALVFSEKFPIDRPRPEVASAVKTYFLANGFRLMEEAPAALRFSRGKKALNFITFNPLKWRSSISVALAGESPVRVLLEARVSTVGQLVTRRERTAWQGFIDNFRRSLVTGSDFTRDNASLWWRAKRANLLILTLAAAAAFVFGFIFFRILLRS